MGPYGEHLVREKIQKGQNRSSAPFCFPYLAPNLSQEIPETKITEGRGFIFCIHTIPHPVTSPEVSSRNLPPIGWQMSHFPTCRPAPILPTGDIVWLQISMNQQSRTEFYISPLRASSSPCLRQNFKGHFDVLWLPSSFKGNSAQPRADFRRFCPVSVIGHPALHVRAWQRWLPCLVLSHVLTRIKYKVGAEGDIAILISAPLHTWLASHSLPFLWRKFSERFSAGRFITCHDSGIICRTVLLFSWYQ